MINFGDINSTSIQRKIWIRRKNCVHFHNFHDLLWIVTNWNRENSRKFLNFYEIRENSRNYFSDISRILTKKNSQKPHRPTASSIFIHDAKWNYFRLLYELGKYLHTNRLFDINYCQCRNWFKYDWNYIFVW